MEVIYKYGIGGQIVKELIAEVERLKAADTRNIRCQARLIEERDKLKAAIMAFQEADTLEISSLKAENESLKAKNHLLYTAIDDQQKRRWEMKQDKLCAEEERDKLKDRLNKVYHLRCPSH